MLIIRTKICPDTFIILNKLNEISISKFVWPNMLWPDRHLFWPENLQSVSYTSNLYQFIYSIHNHHSIHIHYNITLFPTYYLLTYNSNNPYSEDGEFAVPETQESPATFSRNIIKRLGIRRTSSGTDTANPNSNTNVTGHYHKPCKGGTSLHLLHANYRIRSTLILCRYPRAVDHLHTRHAVELFLCIHGSSIRY